MNDDELRDHLRSTLEPVSSPTPELARLRRLARRRRRSLQLTSAALGLLLIAGAGIGIAEATSSNSGPSEVTVGSPPPAPAVTVPCVIEMRGGSTTASVTMAPGQTLVLTNCPQGATVIASSGNAVLSPTGGTAFRAQQSGSSVVTVTYPACAALPASVAPRCAGGLAQERVHVTVTGHAPPNPPAASVVTVPCTQASVQLIIGQTLAVDGCGADKQLGSYAESDTIVQQVGPTSFLAIAVGAGTKVSISQRCPNAQSSCPASPSIAIITVQVVGDSSSNTRFVDEVEPPCTGGRLTIPTGDRLLLTNCPAGLQSKVDDPSVLAPAGTPNMFTAVKPGTTNVELFVKPQCSPGMMCPQYIRALGTLVVTVTAE